MKLSMVQKIESFIKKIMRKVSKKKKCLLICVILLILLGLAITAYIMINNKEKSDTNTQNISKVVKNITNSTQENITITDVSIQALGSNMQVKGVLKNTGEEIKSMEVVFYLYSENKQIRGKQLIKMEDLKNSESRTFTISIMGDYEGINQYEIKLENIEK